ncbi:MAG: signal peptide peptidase SppA, partial [Verrucomicrobiota bacterium]
EENKRIEPPEVKPRPKSKSMGLWVIGIGVLLLLLISFAFNLIFFLGMATGGGVSVTSGSRAVDEFPQFTEKWSYGSGETKVVRIAVQGVIARDSSGGFFASSEDKIQSILKQIRFAANDPEVKGLIVEVDSPGGAITPSDEIYHALKEFKKDDAGRKVLAFTKDLSASGGYYVSMAADRIMAEPTAIIGSIGVIMQSFNFAGLSEKIGVTDTTIKSGENKDLLNPFREASSNQVELLQVMVDEMYERFLGIVKEGRGMSDEKARPLADGRVFSAETAQKEGLIDELGYWDDAVAAMGKLLGTPTLRIVRYTRPAGFMDLLGEIKVSDGLQSLLEPDAPKVMTIWRP